MESNHIATTELRIKNKQLIEDLEERLVFTQKIYLYTYRQLIREDFREVYETTSRLNTHLCDRFNILSREANSYIKVIQGRLKAFTEVKISQRDELKVKLETDKRRAAAIEKEIRILKKKAEKNKASLRQLKRLRSLKSRFYNKKNKINRKEQALENLSEKIKTGRLRIGWGSRKAFKAQFHLEENGLKDHQDWYEYYRSKRDHQITYIGRAAEVGGTQFVRLSINEENGTLELRLRDQRRDRKNYKNYSGLRIKYLKDDLYEILRKKRKQALTLRFLKRGRKWYLQIIFKRRCPPVSTTSFYGTIGLDYNDGMIALSETNEHGNLVLTRKIPLEFHGTGKKATTEIRNVCAAVSNHALERGKDVIVEDLDFKRTKAQTLKGRNKRSNRMIHCLDYHRFKETIGRACAFRGVDIKFVDPAYSSVNAIKYQKDRKLVIHQAAALVIARRGMNLKD